MWTGCLFIRPSDRPSVRPLSVRCPLAPISRDALSPQLVEGFQWNVAYAKNCIYAAVHSCWLGVPLVWCICRLGCILLFLCCFLCCFVRINVFISIYHTSGGIVEKDFVIKG